MEVVHRHRLAPLAFFLARHSLRLDVVLPEFATAQAKQLHSANGVVERSIPKAVALDAERHRVALAARGEQPAADAAMKPRRLSAVPEAARNSSGWPASIR